MTSYVIEGHEPNLQIGQSVSIGDIDGDGILDFLIGALFGARGSEGGGYVITAASLADADAADGSINGRIDSTLIPPQTDSYEFHGELGGDDAGHSVSMVGDFDGDGLADIVVGAPGASLNDAGSIYLLSSQDAAAADAADGSMDGHIQLTNVAAQANSFQIDGDLFSGVGLEAGTSVSSAGDFDGDGLDDLFIGAPFSPTFPAPVTSPGFGYLVSSAELSAFDADDGLVDGVIDLDFVPDPSGDSYIFYGNSNESRAGHDVEIGGDTNGDGQIEFLITQPGDFAGPRPDEGAVYVLSGDELEATDQADGVDDNQVGTKFIPSASDSYGFFGEFAHDNAGVDATIRGDFDNDGNDDLIIGASGHDTTGTSAGSVYVISSADFAAADLADGTADGFVDLANVAAQAGSFQLFGEEALDEIGTSVEFIDDVNGDGVDEILIGAPEYDDGFSSILNHGGAYLIASSDLVDADAADGLIDGDIDLANISLQRDSYKFIGANAGDRAGFKVSSAGDFDTDGRADIAITAPGNDDGEVDGGAVYLIAAADLDTLDIADGVRDHIIHLDSVAPCFARGTTIMTTEGDVPVEELTTDHEVITRDSGFKKILWVGSSKYSAEELRNSPKLVPVRIRKSAFGLNTPAQDLVVSPLHKILLKNERAELLTGDREVFITAKHLVGLRGVDRVEIDDGGVEYFHILTERHEVLYSNHIPTESFYPGKIGMLAMSPENQVAIREVLQEIPYFRDHGTYGLGARMTVSKAEAALLLQDGWPAWRRSSYPVHKRKVVREHLMSASEETTDVRIAQ